MARFELAHDGDAVRAHDEMNRPLRQRFAEAAGPSATWLTAASSTSIVTTTSRSAASSAIDGCRVRACRRERRRLRRELIEYLELVTRVEQATRHSLSHTAEANETDFHLSSSNSDRKWVRDFDPRPLELQLCGPAARGAPARVEPMRATAKDLFAA